MSSASLAVLALTVMLAVGCATPRYETRYRLEPPADPGSRSCLAGCEAQLKTCQDGCGLRYQACVREVEPQVDEAYAEALRRYAFDLDTYAASLQHYELQVWMGWHHGPWWITPGWSTYPYYVSRPPPRPSRQQVRDRLVAEKCPQDCGCQPAYEACFLACGGKKIAEEHCVANCPAR